METKFKEGAGESDESSRFNFSSTFSIKKKIPPPSPLPSPLERQFRSFLPIRIYSIFQGGKRADRDSGRRWSMTLPPRYRFNPLLSLRLRWPRNFRRFVCTKRNGWRDFRKFPRFVNFSPGNSSIFHRRNLFATSTRVDEAEIKDWREVDRNGIWNLF